MKNMAFVVDEIGRCFLSNYLLLQREPKDFGKFSSKKKRHIAVSLFNSHELEHSCLVAGDGFEPTTFGL